MATVDKNFKVKNGLVVEGTTATVNGEDIITTGSTTDDLGEGTTNKYYSTTQAKSDAADLLTGATLTNITITGDETGLTITAENGVADSDTDDLAEGTTNKYYSDTLVDNHLSGGSGINYSSGTISVDLTPSGGLYLPLTDDIAIDRTTVDTWYDAAGAAAAAQTAAESYADGLATNYEASGAVSTHAGLTTTHGVTGNIVGTSDAQTLTNKTLGDDLLMDGYQISGLGSPTQADHAATKSYVDAVSEGLHVHEAVRVAVNGNIAIATALENGDTAGGVTLATGDRVLLKDQTTTSENGIYVVQASGQALRAADFDTATEVASGDFVFVTSGTYANTGWVQTLNPATIGTDPINFTQFSGAGTFLAGNGLILDGNTFEIDETITATRTFASSEASAAQSAAESYADGLAANYEVAGAAQAAVDALDTDDIEEGTTNKYFTDTRAVDALEAVVPNFTAVEVNSLAKQVAATSSSLGSVVVTAYSFPKATYRTAKFIVKIDNGTENEVTEVLLTLDSADNIAITEYAIVGTNGNRGSITADISGSDVRLRIDPVNDSTINVVGTLLA